MFGAFVRPKHPAWYVPTLFQEGSQPASYDPLCEVVLFALNEGPEADEKWDGRWRIDQRSVLELTGYMNLFNQSFTSFDLTLDQLLAFIREESNHQKVKKLPCALHGLLGEELVKEAFADFDTDNNGQFSKEEFAAFLHGLKCVHLQYLLRSSLQQYRAFFGRGYELRDEVVKDLRAGTLEELHAADDSGGAGDGEASKQEGGGDASSPDSRSPKDVESPSGGEDPETTETTPINQSALIKKGKARLIKAHNFLRDGVASEKRSLTFLGERPSEDAGTFFFGLDPDRPENSLVPKGWWEDLYYYSANWHPIHGIFACDPANMLSSMERVFIEVATITFALITTMKHHEWVEQKHAPYEWLENELAYSLLIVSLPSIIMWQVLVALFSRMGLMNTARGERFSREKVEQARMRKYVGETCGYILVTALMLYCAYIYKACFGHFYDLEEMEDGHMQRVCMAEENIPTVVRGRLMSYVINWVTAVVLAFNPIVAWGQPDPSASFVLGDYIGIGQWRIERLRFKWRCHNGIGQLEEHIRERRQACFSPASYCSAETGQLVCAIQ